MAIGGSYRALRALGAVLTLVALVGYGRPALQVLRQTPVLWIFGMWTSATLLWSRDRPETLVSIIGLASISLLSAVLVVIGRSQDLRKLLMVLFTATSVVSLVLIAILPRISTRLLLHPTRGVVLQPQGVFIWNSELGFSAGIAATLALAAMAHRPNWKLTLIFSVNILAVMISNSVTSVVVAAAGLAVVLFFSWRRLFLGLSIASLGAILVVGFRIGFPTLWGAFLSSIGRSPNLTGRTILWDTTLGQMRDRWMIGNGAGLSPDFEGISQAQHAHNGYLQIVFDRGFVGLAILAIICFFAIRAWSRRPDAAGLGTVAMVLVANVGNDYFTYASLGMLLLLTSDAVFESSGVSAGRSSQLGIGRGPLTGSGDLADRSSIVAPSLPTARGAARE